MVCLNCNASLQGAGSFCPQCGSPIPLHAGPGNTSPSGYVPASQGPPPPAYGQPAPGQPAYPSRGYPAGFAPRAFRVQRNLQILSILWICLAVYRILSMLAVTSFFHAVARGGFMGRQFPFDPGSRPFFAAMIPFVLTLTVLIAVLCGLVAFGLMQRRPWGRTFAIVMAIISLLKFPLGTALGIYTLWVLTPATSAMEYDSIADRTRPGF